MGFLDMLFGSKESEQEVIDGMQENEQKPEESQPEEDTELEKICDYCKEELTDQDKVTKFSKSLFHRKCFKRMKKDAQKVTFG